MFKKRKMEFIPKYKIRIALLIIMCSLFIFSGCNGTVSEPNQSNNDPNPSKIEIKTIEDQKKENLEAMIPGAYSIKKESFDVPSQPLIFAETDDTLIIYGWDYNEDNTGHDHYLKIHGSEGEKTVDLRGLPMDVYVDSMYLSGEQLYFTCHPFFSEIKPTSATMYSFSLDGNLLFQKNVSDFVSDKEKNIWLFPDRQSGIWLSAPSDGFLYFIGESGDVKQEIAFTKDFPGIFFCGNDSDTIFAVAFTDTLLDVGKFHNAHKKSETFLMEGFSGMRDVYFGENEDLLVLTDKSIYRVSLGDKCTAEEILVFSDYGIDPMKIRMVREKNEDSLVLILDEAMTHSISRILLTPSTTSDGSKDLQLACITCPDYLRYAVGEYNVSHNETHITIKEYYDKYAIDTSMEDAINRFNSDLMDQTAGDLVCLDGVFRYEDRDSFLNKGLFVDFNELMDSDPSFDQNDYFTNIWKVNEVKGKLYSMVPMFTFNTKYGLTADLKNAEHLDESVFDTDDPALLYGPTYTQTQFLHDLCVFTLGDIRDQNAVLYDTVQMERYFTFAAKLPEFEVRNSEGKLSEEWQMASTQEWIDLYHKKGRFGCFSDDCSNSYYSQIRLASILLSDDFMGEEEYYEFCSQEFSEEKVRNAQMTIGEEVKAIGFPVKEGRGSSLINGMELSIPKASHQSSVAWEFIKFMLSEDLQGLELYASEGIMVNKNVFEERTGLLIEFQSAESDPYYGVMNGFTDFETGEEVNYYIPSTHQWMVDEVTDLINEVTYLDSTDPNVEEILKEELTKYTKGQQTAKEAAEKVASRVRLYADERE